MRSIKYLAASAILAAGFMAADSAQAGPVTYWTSGAFSNPAGSHGVLLSPNSVKFNNGSRTVTITFNGVDGNSPIGVIAPIGSFTVDVSGGMATNSVSTVADFDLTIHQTMPSPRIGDFDVFNLTDAVKTNPTVRATQSSIIFTYVSVSINGVSYRLANSAGDEITSLLLPNGGTANVYAIINDSGGPPSTMAPEPSTIAMALTALVPLGFAGLRRLRRRPDVTSA
ncbi:hypothetical protein BH23PLA1_BH23PLA1_21450 [soil metagenome]